MTDTKEFFTDLLAEGFLDHFTEVNTTLPYYPILMYSWIYACGLQNILEIGTLRGFTSYYLARAAKVNKGHFYGVDIHQPYCDMTKAGLDKFELPNTIVCADTKTMTKLEFAPRIDFAFLDGEHTTEAVLHEVELIYPLMPDNGTAFIFIHDIVDQGNSDVWWKLKRDPRFEGVGLNNNYGLGILRKLQGVDYEGLAKRFGILKFEGGQTVI